jgi:thiamine biosynthesis lipoprotein
MANGFHILNGYKGLGTAFFIELFLTDEEKESLPLAQLQKDLEETIDSFGMTYSRFREDSLLTTLNTKRIIPKDFHMEAMLRLGMRAHEDTDGVFDLCIKERLEQKGYGGVSQENQREAHNKEHASEKTKIELHDTSIALTGTEGIDLGGVGKGYLIDLLAKLLQETYHIPYFVINGGGDIYVTSNEGEPVALFLEHPLHENESIGSITLTNQSLCSSSSFKRSWLKNGERVNHFIGDKEVWAVSYITASSTTYADIYATVFCLLSEQEEKLAKLAKKHSLDYLVINEEGKVFGSPFFKKSLYTEI